MATDSAEYRKVFKGISLFGGVQVYNVIISLIRGKIIAQFLGSEGMGLSGLYVSSLTILITLAGLGCNLSAVRYISVLQKNTIEYYRLIFITKKIFLVLSLAGLFITLMIAYPLSVFTFDNTKHIISYFLLSLYVFFTLYNQGQSAILQAMQELKAIALGNIIPSTLFLIVSIPIYYYFELTAIVPMLILSSLLGFIYMYFVLTNRLKRIEFYEPKIPRGELINVIKKFVGLGLITVLASVLGNIASYIINTFISHSGSFSDVGLYNAGISITNQYIGLVFAAMAVDYFPRLVSACMDVKKMNETINYQGEIIMLLGAPLLSLLMLTAPLCIKILLTDEFMTINGFIRILSYGMVFKIASYCLGYVSFAKGDKKTYFWLEGVVSNILTIALNCLGYYFMGLRGVAISFCVIYFVYLCVIMLYVRKKYGVILTNTFFSLILLFSISLTILLILTEFMQQSLITIILSVVLSLILCVFSLRQLNQKIGFIDLIKSKINK